MPTHREISITQEGEEGSRTMGVWDVGVFDNDDALDFVDDLRRRGIPALRNALGRQLLEGIERASKRVSPEEIEAKVQTQLEKHRQQLARGLSVGPILEAERAWRVAFELDAKERRVWEIFGFAAAVAVLRKQAGLPERVPTEVYEWIERNQVSLKRASGRLISTALATWSRAESGIEYIRATLESERLESWLVQIPEILEDLKPSSAG